MTRLAVILGGPSPEHDVSILTGLMAARTLLDAGRDVEVLYWSKSAELFAVDANLEPSAFAEGVPRRARPLRFQAGPGGGFVQESAGLGRRRTVDVDVVVNCCHGGPGEDGTLQAALDLAGIRYTGPTVAGAALGMDKLAFAAVVSAAGLPHLPMAAAGRELPKDAPFPGPYIVKPRFGGSSLGIEQLADWPSVVAFLSTARPMFAEGAVVEPYRAGAVDLNIAIRTHPRIELSAIERPLRSTADAAILDYRDKYVGAEGMSSAPREIPAQITPEQERSIRDAALQVADLAQVRGVARLDFLADGDELFVNEINTIPGSLAKHLWVEPSLPFARLLDDIIDEASTGRPRAFQTHGADGTVLRSAGAIASKLG